MRARNVDGNQVAVVEALRASGVSVRHLHTIGQDFPDLIIGGGGIDQLAEVKDGRKPESARRLSPGQEQFRNTWRGRTPIVLLDPIQAFEVGRRLIAEGARR